MVNGLYSEGTTLHFLRCHIYLFAVFANVSHSFMFYVLHLLMHYTYNSQALE